MNIFQKMKEEKEENRRKNPENKPTQAQATMKVVCGGYLFYLIYQIIKDGGLVQTHGWQLALMILGLVSFAVAGSYCIYTAIKLYLKNDFYNPNAPVAEKIEEQGDDEPVSEEETQE